jgi:hypothetical protein
MSVAGAALVGHTIEMNLNQKEKGREDWGGGKRGERQCQILHLRGLALLHHHNNRNGWLIKYPK